MSLIQGGGMILILLSVICFLLGGLVYVQTKRVDAQELAAAVQKESEALSTALREELGLARFEIQELTKERDFMESELSDLIVGFEMATDIRSVGT